MSQRVFLVALAVYHLLFLVGFTSLVRHPTPIVLFNSDSMFLQDFAQDMLSGENFRDWFFPIAPFVFPDAVLSLPAAVVGWNNPPLYVAVYGYLQLGLALTGVALIASQLSGLLRLPDRQRWIAAATAALVAGSIYWLLVLWVLYTGRPLTQGAPPLLQPFLPQVHSGTYAWTLLCYGLFLRWRRQPLSARGTGWLLTCLTLGSAGNTLFLVTALLPIVCAMSLSQMLQQRPFVAGGRRMKLWPVALGGVFVLGRVISHIIPHASMSGQSKISVEATATALRTFLAGYRDALLAVDLAHWLCLIAAVVLYAWLHQLPRRVMLGRIPADLTFLCLFTTAALLTPLSLIVGGNVGLVRLNDYPWTLKYLLPMTAGPALAVYLLAWSYFQSRRSMLSSAGETPLPRAAVGGIVATFAVALLTLAWNDAGIFRYRPPLVAKLEACPALRDVDRLFVDFWQARMINLCSAGRFQASQCGRDLAPFRWLANLRRIENATEAEGRFAVLFDKQADSPEGVADRKLCEEKLGPPREIAAVDEQWTAYIYDAKVRR